MKKHCVANGAYCHSGMVMGKKLISKESEGAGNGPQNVIMTGIAQLCLLKQGDDIFFEFIKHYRKSCLRLAENGNAIDPYYCLTAIFLSVESLKEHYKTVMECTLSAFKYDLEIMRRTEELFYADIAVFDEQEWYYKVGSPVITPALFINRDFRIHVRL